MVTCQHCSTTLGPKNRSGLCRSCLARRINADPAVAARRRAAIQARFEDPEVVAGYRARLKRYMDNMPAAERVKRAARGRELYSTILTRPDVMAKREAARLAPETTARQGRTLSNTMLPWCPEGYRPLYRDLRRIGVPVNEARSAVEAQIAHDNRPKPKRPLTHQEQLARVAAGAKLIEVRPLPTRQRTHTSGGVATGML